MAVMVEMPAVESPAVPSTVPTASAGHGRNPGAAKSAAHAHSTALHSREAASTETPAGYRPASESAATAVETAAVESPAATAMEPAAAVTTSAAAVTTSAATRERINRRQRSKRRERRNTDHEFSEHGSLLPDEPPHCHNAAHPGLFPRSLARTKLCSERAGLRTNLPAAVT
jgi:hypothetical protein